MRNQQHASGRRFEIEIGPEMGDCFKENREIAYDQVSVIVGCIRVGDR
jgi:hypothetical protein